MILNCSITGSKSFRLPKVIHPLNCRMHCSKILHTITVIWVLSFWRLILKDCFFQEAEETMQNIHLRPSACDGSSGQRAAAAFDISCPLPLHLPSSPCPRIKWQAWSQGKALAGFQGLGRTQLGTGPALPYQLTVTYR